MSTPFEDLLADAYTNVGAYDPDVIYLYSDFRTFGRHLGEFRHRSAFCDAVVMPFLKRGKTVVMTTFTYTTSGRFDVLSTPTMLGVLNKWILAQPGVCRSEHPLFSYAAIGPKAHLMMNIGTSAFGHDSVFERLLGQQAAFLHVGRPVWMGNTALHHVEHLGGATYRIHKAFRTEVFRGEQYLGTDYTAFLRRMDVPGETFAFTFRDAAAQLAARGLVRQVGADDDLTNISLLWYDDTLSALHEMFRADPTIFIGSPFIQY